MCRAAAAPVKHQQIPENDLIQINFKLTAEVKTDVAQFLFGMQFIVNQWNISRFPLCESGPALTQQTGVTGRLPARLSG